MYTLDEFSTIFRNKMSFSRIKKIHAIKEYFMSMDTHTLVAQDAEDFLLEIITFTNNHPDLEEQVFHDVIEILFDRYSKGTPYQLYDINLPQNSSFQEMNRSLTRFFSGQIQRDMFDFIPDNVFEIDEISEEITIKMRYREFEKDIITGDRSNNIIVSGQIPIFINRIRKKALISTGNLKATKLIVGAINVNLGTTITLSKIEIEDEAKRMPNLVANDRFAPLTILAVMLILVDLNPNNFIINDLLSIAFNNNDAPRVKNAQLGGNHLLQDVDVIHRIYRGDRITNFLLSFVHLNAREAADLTGVVLFDFRTGFKLQFGDSTTGSYKKTSAAMDIEVIIRTTLNNPQTVYNAMQAIQTRLPNIPVHDQQLMRDIFVGLRDTLSGLLPNDKAIMVEYLNRTYGL
jgi:hypothetical protein